MLRSVDEIDTIVIHCADTPDGSRQYTIIDIDTWHRRRKWARDDEIRLAARPHLRSVGYHAVIDSAGAIARGRSIVEVGAHAEGINKSSIGICLLGRSRYSGAAWIALDESVSEIESQCKINRIIGHRDVASYKSCPGFSVSDWLANGRRPLDGHRL